MTAITPEFDLPDNIVDSSIATLVELARIAADPVQLTPDAEFLVANPDGTHERFRTEALPLRSPRLKASRLLEDLDTFISFLERHESEFTEVYASKQSLRFHAVIDGAASNMEAEDERFGREAFNAVFSLRATESWKAWTGISGKFLAQSEFAEFIEDWADDVHAPDSATVLEIAQSLQASSGVEFSSSRRLDSGEVQFGYTETIKARAGQRGDLTIPKELTLALQPFEGVNELQGKVTRVPVTARFRYRINDGDLRLGVKLIGLDRIIETFWAKIVEEVRSRATSPVFIGLP
jgi:uncharacterized protein YfdQ (DUF2303 family)